MLLQCDPTVIYALEQQGRYNGTLSTADLHIDSPYNSYTHTGLPPGPIGNPGEASLRAAYQPAHTNYLYFVANTQGGHFFSATLAEHNNNVIKYRRLLAGEQASTSMNESSNTKKSLILQAARQIGVQKWTPAEIDQLRRRLIAEHGEAGKTGSEYIADVLEAAGLKLELTLQEEAEDQYEEEFEDLLHFKTLEDAEVSVMRLDELMRKFRSQGEHAAVERVLNVARLGKRRAEMISRNQKVEAPKRAEKEEIANWFRIWLENPDAFFDWLDLRKQSPEFQSKFPQAGLVE